MSVRLTRSEWGGKNFINVRVFNPLQLSILTNISRGAIRIMEQEKKCHYETQIFKVEYSPLVFSVCAPNVGGKEQ